MIENAAFTDLDARIGELIHLQYISGILNWDMRTYMPQKAYPVRADALSTLSKVSFEKLVDPKMGELISACQKSGRLNQKQQREVVLIDRLYQRNNKIPKSLIGKISKQGPKTEQAWLKAKKSSDFSLVRTELEDQVDLMKQKAAAIDPSKNPWDVLSDEHEPNLGAAKITELFTPMKKGVLEVMKLYDQWMTDCNEVPPIGMLKVPVPVENQRKVTDYLFDLLQIDRGTMRADETEHPFTDGYIDDCRVTTHYMVGSPMDAFYSTLHEIGHGLYLNNAKTDKIWSLHGNSIHGGMHESQSRFVENLIGKNPNFLRFVHPHLVKHMNPLKNISTTQFIRAVNAIVPNKIRIYSDEVTYNLHIILRFEIERDLFDDKITVAELPHVWNEKIQETLGIEPDNDSEGVLQDIHWYMGLFGYFPTYALGNLYNGQMHFKMQQDLPGYEDNLLNGNIMPVLNWQKEKVHQMGNMYDPLDAIEKITGEPLSSYYFVDYLKQKFTKIFE